MSPSTLVGRALLLNPGVGTGCVLSLSSAFDARRALPVFSAVPAKLRFSFSHSLVRIPSLKQPSLRIAFTSRVSLPEDVDLIDEGDEDVHAETGWSDWKKEGDDASGSNEKYEEDEDIDEDSDTSNWVSGEDEYVEMDDEEDKGLDPEIRMSDFVSEEDEMGSNEDDRDGVDGEGDEDCGHSVSGTMKEDMVERKDSTPEGDLLNLELLEEAKVFVGNLPLDIDGQKLAELFSKAGMVEIAEVIFNRDTDMSRGFGFVTMGTVEESVKAIRMFHGHEVGGKFIAVSKAVRRGMPLPRLNGLPSRGFKAFCGNVSYDVDDSKLGDLFREYGNVLESFVVCDKGTRQSRGFGFVTMSTETELEDCIAALDGQRLGGRRLRVSRAEERPGNTSV